MPSIQKLYNDYNDKVVFILVSDEKPTKLNSFLQRNDYKLPIYSNVSSTLKEFESSSIPATFLVDKKGKVVIDKKGPADWNSNKTRAIIDKLIQANY
jgi:peroxiredoxin